MHGVSYVLILELGIQSPFLYQEKRDEVWKSFIMTTPILRFSRCWMGCIPQGMLSKLNELGKSRWKARREHSSLGQQ